MFFSGVFLDKFNSPKAYRWGVIAGLLVALPTLFSGLFLDDYLHLLTIEGVDGGIGIATPSEVFQFSPGNPEKIKELMNSGPYPWFTMPDLQIKFMRPFSSLLMVLDSALFGRNPFFYHVHSLLWYLACLVIVSRLFKSTLPYGLGALALFLYALDVGHMIPVGWWSNRNSLVSGVPAMLGLLWHIRYREENWAPGLPLSIIGYAFGLAGGETALGIFGYLIAYEAVAAPGNYVKKFFMLVPGGILGLIYIVLYKVLDYGVHGSGVYIDPSRETLEYIINAPSRLVLIAAGHFAMLPSELPIMVPAAYWPFVILACVILAVMLRLLYLAWPSIGLEHRRHVRWYLLGALVSSLPVLATFPSIRLLMLPSLGLIVALAIILQYLLRQTFDTAPKWQVYMGRALAVVHIVFAPLMWLGFSAALLAVDTHIQHLFLHPQYKHEDLEGKRVMILHAENPIFGIYPMIAHHYYDLPHPKSWWPLSVAPYPHRVTRTGDKTIEIEVVGGEMLTTDFERLLRASEPSLTPGDTVMLEGMTVTVLETGQMGPKKFKVEVENSLDNPEYVYLAWQESALRVMQMPPLGGVLELPLGGLF